MVHAYLMYGFPTQIGSGDYRFLEMVRQYSGNWRIAIWVLAPKFAMTVHSPVGIKSNAFAVKTVSTEGSLQ